MVVEVDAVVVMVVRARGHPHLAAIRGLAIHVHDAHLRAILVMAVVGALLGAVGPVVVVAVVLLLDVILGEWNVRFVLHKSLVGKFV